MSINKMTITLFMDNAAFDEPGKWKEVSRILRRLTDRLGEGSIMGMPGSLSDINGQSVGTIRYEEV